MNEMPPELIAMQESLMELALKVKAMAAEARISPKKITDGTDLDHAERTIRDGLFDLGRRLVTEYFRNVGTGDLGFRVEFDGVTYTRKQRSRECSIVSGFGPVSYCQSVYYSKTEVSRRPLKEMVNLPDRGVTYLAQDIMARLGIEETYSESQLFYKDFFGYSPSSRTIEQVVIETANSYPAYRETIEPPSEEAKGRIGVLSFDGKGVRVVPSERTTGKTREALVGCIYTQEAEQRDGKVLAESLVFPDMLSESEKKDLQRQHRAENIHYFGSITQSKDEVFGEVREAADARFSSCAPTATVCLMDGALKLWQLAHKHFPNAVYILDLMHVLGYLRPASAALTKEGDDVSVLLLKYLNLIFSGRVNIVIKSLKIRLKKNKLETTQRKVIQAAITYFSNHRDYMNYNEYLAAGYPIASGVIESACKHLIKNRMDRSGAQWSLIGADAVIRMRCVKASDQWNQFRDTRQKNELKRLYQNPLDKAA